VDRFVGHSVCGFESILPRTEGYFEVLQYSVLFPVVMPSQPSSIGEGIVVGLSVCSFIHLFGQILLP